MADSTLINDVFYDQPPQDRSIAQAIESNLADYWIRLGMNPKGEVCSTSDIRWEYSGSPFLNRVVESQLARENADQTIDTVKSTFISRRAAVTWFVGAGGSPEDLGARLVEHGFSRYDDWIGMAHSLTGLRQTATLPPGIEIVEVDTPSHRDDWIRVVGRSFRFPRSARCRLRQTLDVDSCVDSRSEMHHLLVYRYGAPVSACSLFIKGGVAGIYLVSTVPEQRGNGLGTRITRYALTLARDLGCQLAVLQSTEQARAIYESLGFCSHSRIGVYRFDAPSPLWKRIARHSFRAARRILPTGIDRRGRRKQNSSESVATGDRPAPSHAH